MDRWHQFGIGVTFGMGQHIENWGGMYGFIAKLRFHTYNKCGGVEGYLNPVCEKYCKEQSNKNKT